MKYQIYTELCEGLKYCVETEHGILEDLKKQIGDSLVNEFCILGWIHLGYTLTEETWSVTQRAKRYYKIVILDCDCDCE